MFLQIFPLWWQTKSTPAVLIRGVEATPAWSSYPALSWWYLLVSSEHGPCLWSRHCLWLSGSFLYIFTLFTMCWCGEEGRLGASWSYRVMSDCRARSDGHLGHSVRELQCDCVTVWGCYSVTVWQYEGGTVWLCDSMRVLQGDCVMWLYEMQATIINIDNHCQGVN